MRGPSLLYEAVRLLRPKSGVPLQDSSPTSTGRSLHPPQCWEKGALGSLVWSALCLPMLKASVHIVPQPLAPYPGRIPGEPHRVLNPPIVVPHTHKLERPRLQPQLHQDFFARGAPAPSDMRRCKEEVSNWTASAVVAAAAVSSSTPVSSPYC